MIRFQRNQKRLDFGSPARATKLLADLGFSITRAGTNAMAYDMASGKFKAYAANTYRFCSMSGRTGLCVEPAQTNLALRSSDLNNAAWVNLGTAPTRTTTNINSCIEGGTGVLVAAGASNSGLRQDIGTFSGSDETLYFIVEAGTSPAVDCEIYDQSGPVSVARVRLTFATGATSVIAGSPTYYSAGKLNAAGPNGGALWMIVIIANGTATNTRRIRIFIDPTGTTRTAYLHHCQFTADSYGGSPIVTAGVSATRDADVIVSTTRPNWWSESMTVVASGRNFSANSIGESLFSSSEAGSTNDCVTLGKQLQADFAVIYVGGVGSDSSTLAPITFGTSFTSAVSYEDNYLLSASGGAAGSDNFTGSVGVYDTFHIGSFCGVAAWWGGQIYSIKFTPKAMQSAELVARAV